MLCYDRCIGFFSIILFNHAEARQVQRVSVDGGFQAVNNILENFHNNKFLENLKPYAHPHTGFH